MLSSSSAAPPACVTAGCSPRAVTVLSPVSTQGAEGRKEGCHKQIDEVALSGMEKKVQLLNRNLFRLAPKISFNRFLTLDLEGGEFTLLLKLLTEYQPVAS